MKSFIVACKDFFGLLPGQTAMQFAQEIKPLTYEERMQLWRDMQAGGIECQQPAPPAAAA